jgi:hypothetical protein
LGWGAGRAAAQNGVPVPVAPKAAAVGQQPAVLPRPDLKVEYFGAERGYAVGTDNVAILCILRNAGNAPLPANSVRLYCYPLVGLDYTSGEIKPVLPELAPGQSLAFRWQLAPSNGQTKLLTAVMLQSNTATSGVGTEPMPNAVGGPNPAGIQPPPESSVPADLPRAVLAAIPHCASEPALGNIRAGTPAALVAVGTRNNAWLANDRVSLHVRGAAGEEAVLSLAAKDGTEWRVLGTVNSLVEILSSEDGQKAWWHRFHWQNTLARGGRDEGVMTLTGSLGGRWTAEFIVTARRDTGVVEGKIRLTARQTSRLFGVRLPGLLTQTDPAGGGLGRADGRAIALPVEDPSMPDAPRLVAAHRGNVTFGLAWPARTPLDGWTSDAQVTGSSSIATALSGLWSSQDVGDVVQAGSTVEIPFRFFAFAPSDTVHDAQRFALP